MSVHRPGTATSASGSTPARRTCLAEAEPERESADDNLRCPVIRAGARWIRRFQVLVCLLEPDLRHRVLQLGRSDVRVDLGALQVSAPEQIADDFERRPGLASPDSEVVAEVVER